MKIGIDYDGTITDAPELFSILSEAIIKSGGEVYVITYRTDSKEEIQKLLAEHKISYTDIVLPEEDDDFATWKAKQAQNLGIDCMFEDSPEVLMNMPEHIKRFWICNPEVINLKSAILGIRSDLRMGTIR